MKIQEWVEKKHKLRTQVYDFPGDRKYHSTVYPLYMKRNCVYVLMVDFIKEKVFHENYVEFWLHFIYSIPGRVRLFIYASRCDSSVFKQKINNFKIDLSDAINRNKFDFHFNVEEDIFYNVDNFKKAFLLKYNGIDGSEGLGCYNNDLTQFHYDIYQILLHGAEKKFIFVEEVIKVYNEYARENQIEEVDLPKITKCLTQLSSEFNIIYFDDKDQLSNFVVLDLFWTNIVLEITMVFGERKPCFVFPLNNLWILIREKTLNNVVPDGDNTVVCLQGLLIGTGILLLMEFVWNKHESLNGNFIFLYLLSLLSLYYFFYYFLLFFLIFLIYFSSIFIFLLYFFFFLIF